MTDFLKIAKSIVVHFAHICAYGVETVKPIGKLRRTGVFFPNDRLGKVNEAGGVDEAD